MDREYCEKYMRLALEQADNAARIGEIPVGAVIVRGGSVLSKGFNRRETGRNALLHAEIVAINEACRETGSWRLTGCEMFVTLEPCPMCAGAIINSRIPAVVFGAYDSKAGACSSVINLFACPFNHEPKVAGGILEKECADKIHRFFSDIRGN